MITKMVLRHRRLYPGFLSLACMLIKLQEGNCLTFSNAFAKRNNQYDYIVVGAGPGGCAATNLLSAGTASVLLLEAGEDHDNNIDISDSSYANSVYAEHFTEFFWQAAQQFNPITSGDPQYTSGRLMGGGSSINGEQFVRPTSELLDELQAAAGGDSDWSARAIYQTLKVRYTWSITGMHKFVKEVIIQGATYQVIPGVALYY